MFPLKRLHSLISTGLWSETESEKLWNSTYSCPYQLWDRDPSAGGVLSLQMVEVECPLCCSDVKIDMDAFVDIRANGLALCPSCKQSFRVKSMMPPQAPCSKTITQPPVPSSVVWKDLSLDLVAASLRQRTFAEKITRLMRGVGLASALTQGITRYQSFMLLMTRTSSLVPTLDIDLCWHTHQLYLGSYQRWCIHHIGRVIDHDDTIGKAGENQGLRKTSLVWFQAYHKGYASNDLRNEYFSRARRVAGVLFLPYGLYVIWKGYKLNQTRLRIITRVCKVIIFLGVDHWEEKLGEGAECSAGSSGCRGGPGWPTGGSGND